MGKEPLDTPNKHKRALLISEELRASLIDQIPYRNNHLLVIGINSYQDEHINELHFPESDGLEFKNLLHEQYEFEEKNTTELYGENATQGAILDELEKLETLTPDDCIVIFFAGHGYYSEGNNPMGYWIPYDATAQKKRTYISNGQLTEFILRCEAHHILVISDSCFSGTIFEGTRDMHYIEREDIHPSRWAITSGQKEVVQDDSPFIKSLLSLLKQARSAWLAEELRLELKKAVRNQHPDGGPVAHWNDRRGQFVFRRKAGEVHDWNIAVQQDTLSSYHDFLEKYPHGPLAKKARVRLAELESQIEDEKKRWQGVLQKNRLSSFWGYLSDYPNGLFAEEARKKIANLKTLQDDIGTIADHAIKVPEGDFLEEVNGVKFLMKFIPRGEFMMGDSEGVLSSWCRPPRNVVVDEDFWCGEFLVTQELFQAIMRNNPSYFSRSDLNPVEQVSWEHTQEFINRLNQLTKKEYRLPSEAEWEYMASYPGRGNNSQREKEDDLGKSAWYEENSSSTQEVGLKMPNALGLYDMLGNVWEWCEDDMHENYSNAPTTSIAWLDSPGSAIKVIRGGSWQDAAKYCSPRIRSKAHMDEVDNGIGFRLALSFPPKN